MYSKRFLQIQMLILVKLIVVTEKTKTQRAQILHKTKGLPVCEQCCFKVLLSHSKVIESLTKGGSREVKASKVWASEEQKLQVEVCLKKYERNTACLIWEISDEKYLKSILEIQFARSEKYLQKLKRLSVWGAQQLQVAVCLKVNEGWHSRPHPHPRSS